MRDWWLRTFLVLQRPRPVFVALRDDSKESLADRAEPVLAIVLLAGIAGVLSTATAGRLMDPPDGYDWLLVAVWTFIAGSLYGAFGYFTFGALLYGGAKALGSQGSYRRAVYGGDLFRSGGSDTGAGADAFAALGLTFVAWSAILLIVGVRAVHGWTWARALAACALALAAPLAVGLVLSAV
jgi:hypothetical protein